MTELDIRFPKAVQFLFKPARYKVMRGGRGSGSGAPLHDLTQIYPDDIYSPNAVRYYGTGDDVMDRESLRKVNAYKGNPDAPVTMYRAVPANLPQDVKINNGDWVTLSPSYAKLHGEGPLGGDYRVIQQNVPARKLFTSGDSIHEFGYDESGKISSRFSNGTAALQLRL